ncbi:MAG: hypothetical protein P8X74_10830 [Reinekea sp.]|jgi:TPR repeat protein
MPFVVLRWIFHQSWLTQSRRVHEWLMKGFMSHADKGNHDAQELYGFLLLFKGPDDQSKSAGARYLVMCADVDHPKACWQLYQIFTKGGVMGFPVDLVRADNYLALARQGGHPLAVQ